MSSADTAKLANALEGSTADIPHVREVEPNDGGLSLTTAQLMALGGDDRITLDEQSGLNAYGCAPKPTPAIGYASSTASTVSASAFAHARAFHFRLQQEAQRRPAAEVYADAMEEARRRLRGLYGLEENVDIAFGPSGTDLEYLVLATALRDGRKVRNMIVEVDEVGSGCLNAQQGRYFAPHTALGYKMVTGTQVPGFSEDRIAIDAITIRNADGSLRDPKEREQTLIETLERSIGAGERPLLRAVLRSKTGLIAPSLDVLKRLADRFGSDVDVIVDACQGRISPEMVRACLALGATVLITGSKFIGGPPFSAFALVVAPISQRMKSASAAPEGLCAFFARGEMPASWRSMDAVLPTITNFGLLLRLECGLFELSGLLAYPEEALNKAIIAFGEAVRSLPPDAPLALLPEDGDTSDGGLHPLDDTMLYTFRLTPRHPRTGGELTFDDAKAIYEMLYSDMSAYFSDPREKMIAADACHVGQPVRCLRSADGEWVPTVRLSLSAPQVSALAGLDDKALLERFRTELDWICAKIRLVLLLLGEQAKA